MLRQCIVGGNRHSQDVIYPGCPPLLQPIHDREPGSVSVLCCQGSAQMEHLCSLLLIAVSDTCQCSRQDFYIGQGGTRCTVYLSGLLCFVPCCLQTENNRPTTVDAELLYVHWNVHYCTTNNPSSKMHHSRSCACFVLQSHQSSTTPSDTFALAVSIVNTWRLE